MSIVRLAGHYQQPVSAVIVPVTPGSGESVQPFSERKDSTSSGDLRRSRRGLVRNTEAKIVELCEADAGIAAKQSLRINLP